jgi:hypothetical protein
MILFGALLLMAIHTKTSKNRGNMVSFARIALEHFVTAAAATVNDDSNRGNAQLCVSPKKMNQNDAITFTSKMCSTNISSD